MKPSTRYSLIASIIIISIIFALLRIHGLKSEPFQALAHLWVGSLIGSWISLKISPSLYCADFRELTGFSALTLSLVELACFLFIK